MGTEKLSRIHENGQIFFADFRKAIPSKNFIRPVCRFSGHNLRAGQKACVFAN